MSHCLWGTSLCTVIPAQQLYFSDWLIQYITNYKLIKPFLPFITFALPDSPFFNPYVRAVYARSWASGRLHRRQASVRLSVLLFSKPVLEGARSAESGEAGPNPGLALSPPCLLAVSLHPWHGETAFVYRNQMRKGCAKCPSRLSPLLFPPLYWALGCSGC